jgi:hypothetical protein
MVTDYVTPMDKTYAVLGPPKMSLQQGVNETIAWLRTQPDQSPPYRVDIKGLVTHHCDFGACPPASASNFRATEAKRSLASSKLGTSP